MGTVAQGMAFGTGSAVAHRAVDAVVGPRTMHVDHGEDAEDRHDDLSDQVQSSGLPAGRQLCGDEAFDFNQCLGKHNNNALECDFYFDILKTCQQNQQSY